MDQMTVVYNLCHGPGSHFYLLFDIRSSFYSAIRLLNRILHFPFSKIGLGMFFKKWLPTHWYNFHPLEPGECDCFKQWNGKEWYPVSGEVRTCRLWSVHLILWFTFPFKISHQYPSMTPEDSQAPCIRLSQQGQSIFPQVAWLDSAEHIGQPLWKGNLV